MFSGEAAGEAGEGAVGADDAVAGVDDGDWVGGAGGADGAGGVGAEEGLGELAVGGGGAGGDLRRAAQTWVLKSVPAVAVGMALRASRSLK